MHLPNRVGKESVLSSLPYLRRLNRYRVVFTVCLLISVICFGGVSVFAQAPSASAPSVDRVEPPNWWTGQAMNPVRLLIHGANLAHALVTGDDGVTISHVSTSASGTYIFADATIAGSAAIGEHPLHIVTTYGSTSAPFEVDQPLPAQGRFQGFSPDDVIYLIMPDRFSDGDPSNDDPSISRGLYDRGNPHLYHGGDFQGIINHLGYLKDLGITAIWINPVYDNYNGAYSGRASADYHGYGAVNEYAVEEHFGTMAKLRELVDKAHALGIKVIQDQVANHVGQMHPWVHDPPTPTWFNGTSWLHDNNTYQIWTVMDPHGDAAERADTLGGWFANILPDLNQNDPEVARYEIQNTLWWIGMTGFDGIREDTMPYVPRSFWTKWNSAITRQYPNVDAVGEVYDGDASLVSYFQGGKTQSDGIDTKMRSLFDYPGYFPLRRVFAQGDSFHDLADDEAHDWLFTDPNYLVTFLGNHDVQRFMNEAGATPEGLELAFTFLLTNRGIPLIYYGDEIGVPGGNDPDNRRDFPGGFPGDPRNAFSADQRTPEEQAIFTHVRTLTHLRLELAPLRRGAQHTLYYSDKQWAYARVYHGQSVIVALNNDTQPASITVPVTDIALADGIHLTDRLGVIAPVTVENEAIELNLPARSGVVLAQ
jgi:neopullulanase